MSVKEQIEKMKNIQSLLIEFLENESITEENCENFSRLFQINK